MVKRNPRFPIKPAFSYFVHQQKASSGPVPPDKSWDLHSTLVLAHEYKGAEMLEDLSLKAPVDLLACFGSLRAGLNSLLIG